MDMILLREYGLKVLLAALAALLTYWLISAIRLVISARGINPLIKQFFNQVARGRIDAAYLLTTKNYRRHVDRQNFIRMLSGLDLKRYRNLKSGRPRVQEGRIILTVRLNSEDKKQVLPLTSPSSRWARIGALSGFLSFEARRSHATLSLFPISLAEAEDRAEVLRQQLNQASHAYYVLAAPVLEDREYDRLYGELLELEKRYPQVVRPDSPTQRVGEPVDADLPSVTHTIPLLSLDNIFAANQLPGWERRLRRHLDGPSDQILDYSCELKVDGVALALRYEHGVLVQGATRGDGHRGEEITASVRTIRSIPLRLRCTEPPPAWAEIRGEAFLAEAIFSAINQQRRQQDEPPFANARNACAGTLRQLDPHVVASRKVDFAAYGLHLSPELPQPRQQLAALDWLRAAGFKTDAHARHYSTMAEVEQFYQHWNCQRHHLPYGADGVVVKLNDLALQLQAGHTRRAPRWAIAMKFSQTETRTTLRNLVTQVGRTGVVTPVAEFDPVELEGSTVARATLHNTGKILELTGTGLLHVGDTMIVRKAGGIIPEVVRVEPSSPPGEPLFFPRHCPKCGSPLVRESKEVICCVNRNCPAILLGALRHWASRDALDIDGLGSERIEQLVENGLVHTIADLYKLQEVDLVALEGWAMPSACSLLESLESSKHQPWHRVLYGLGIPHVGTANAKILAHVFLSAEQLAEAFSSDKRFMIDDMKDIGPETAIPLRKWLVRPGNLELLTELESSKQPWDRVLSHLPILPLGRARAEALARAFPSAQQLAEAFSPDCPVMNAPNVKGIGPKITLYFQKWLNYAGSREILAELEASQQPWDRVLSDLPVLPLGHARAKALARAFPSAQELAGEFLSDMYFMIVDLEGIDREIAGSLQKWLADPANQNLLAGLVQAGFRLHGQCSEASAGPLTGKTFVLTGTLPSLGRAEAQQRIEAAGGTVTNNVSKKTTYVVVGNNPGGKLDKARDLGVEILDEAGLLQCLASVVELVQPPGKMLTESPMMQLSHLPPKT